MNMPSDKKRLFCSHPFKHLEVTTSGQRGGTFLCCPAWLPVSIGNIRTSSVDEVWNSENAQKIRRSILDGSFQYCTKHCPFLQTVSGPVQAVEDVTDNYMKEIIRNDLHVLPDGPQVINAAFDRSCNLSCPTCRTEHIIEVESQDDIIQLQQRLETEAFGNLEKLIISGSGDAFGSPFFIRWLRTLQVTKYPKLRIHVHSNAQLWTPQIWAKIPTEVQERIINAEISIDAASAQTYAINRRGGEWDILLKNLELIANLRSKGPLKYLQFDMVVQENNFLEMPAFVELGKAHGVDAVLFIHLNNWGTFSEDELKRRAIHHPLHSRHGELLEVLRDPRLRDNIVTLGNLTELVVEHADDNSAANNASVMEAVQW